MSVLFSVGHAEQYAELYRVMRSVPRGRVATYAQIATLAGVPRGGRVAAAALRVSRSTDRLPWQRVIGRASPVRGRIAIHDPVGALRQRHLLEAEGVTVSEGGTIDLRRFGWLPIDAR